jgi:hypothetical protein
MIIVLCHWPNGAYVNTYAGEEFDALYQELVVQYGYLSYATTYDGEV